MQYICIGLILIIIFLSACLFFQRRTISLVVQQMKEIEQHPERNRQLKALSTDSKTEELLSRINHIYQARQKERIIYQRSELQIRREIENISHDLRTPLTSILGYLDLIQEEDLAEEEKSEYFDIIGKRARVLQGFIQDFYEISRIEGDHYPILLEVISVQSMIRDTAVAYYHEFENKKLQVSIDLEEKMDYIIADKIQFHRILNNLIQNALKYAEKLFIIKQFTAGGYCILQFKNDKSNITKAELDQIFDRFYTGDQSRTSQSTGLGLTITKLLVEKMKGSIEARLEDDLFIIELRWLTKAI